MINTEIPKGSLHTIDAAVAALKSGGVVIVVDSPDRENEGDFICAAETITPKLIEMMLTVGRGNLCVPMTDATADRLQLTPIAAVGKNTAAYQTNFLTPLDHVAAGTGVSADNRTRTIRA
ncbi:MAG: 3,4-dihydroxy-2-butanone-4-phosphate synthase, partial [Planctomycetes bacterium]|nr:3,4-dihydroxy-2-butanone-4-phosphate synthase [Planctomycetota bacterium]